MLSGTEIGKRERVSRQNRRTNERKKKKKAREKEKFNWRVALFATGFSSFFLSSPPKRKSNRVYIYSSFLGSTAQYYSALSLLLKFYYYSTKKRKERKKKKNGRPSRIFHVIKRTSSRDSLRPFLFAWCVLKSLSFFIRTHNNRKRNEWKYSFVIPPRCTTGEERGRRARLNLNRKKKKLVED